MAKRKPKMKFITYRTYQIVRRVLNPVRNFLEAIDDWVWERAHYKNGNGLKGTATSGFWECYRNACNRE